MSDSYWYTQSGKGDHEPAILFNAPGCPPDVPIVLLPDGTQLVCSSKDAARAVSYALREFVLQQLSPKRAP